MTTANDHGAHAADIERHARHDRSPHPNPIMPGDPARHPAGECKFKKPEFFRFAAAFATGGFVPQREGEQGRCGFFGNLRQLGGKFGHLLVRLESADYEHLRTLLHYQGLLLAGLAFAAALILGVGDLSTSGSIARRLDEDVQASLQQVLPAGLYDNQPLHDTLKIPSVGEKTGYAGTDVYLARKKGQATGAAFRLIAPDGYSGNISLILGVDSEGKVLGVRVIAHAETPGLGDKIEAAKSDWIKTFDGRSLDDTRWKVKKDGGDFDQFAGATITPRAVVKRVQGGLEFFRRHRDALLEAK